MRLSILLVAVVAVLVLASPAVAGDYEDCVNEAQQAYSNCSTQCSDGSPFCSWICLTRYEAAMAVCESLDYFGSPDVATVEEAMSEEATCEAVPS